MTKEENQLLFLSSKLVVISIVSCLSSLLVFSLFFILWFLSIDLKLIKHLFGFDACLKIMCLWLSFNFTERFWWVYLGGHYCTLKCFPLLKSMALTCFVNNKFEFKKKSKNAANAHANASSGSNNLAMTSSFPKRHLVNDNSTTHNGTALGPTQSLSQNGNLNGNGNGSGTVSNGNEKTEKMSCKSECFWSCLYCCYCCHSRERMQEHRRVYHLCLAEYKLLIDQENERVELAKSVLKLGKGQELDFHFIISEMKHIRSKSDIDSTMDVIRRLGTIDVQPEAYGPGLNVIHDHA